MTLQSGSCQEISSCSQFLWDWPVTLDSLLLSPAVKERHGWNAPSWQPLSSLLHSACFPSQHCLPKFCLCIGRALRLSSVQLDFKSAKHVFTCNHDSEPLGELKIWLCQRVYRKAFWYAKRLWEISQSCACIFNFELWEFGHWELLYDDQAAVVLTLTGDVILFKMS